MLNILWLVGEEEAVGELVLPVQMVVVELAVCARQLGLLLLHKLTP